MLNLILSVIALCLVVMAILAVAAYLNIFSARSKRDPHTIGDNYKTWDH